MLHIDYDDENQLIRVTESTAWKSEFTYDGKMRRRISKEYTWQGAWVLTNETRYVYDGILVIQERDCLNELVVTYTRGRDLSGSLEAAGGIGGLLSRTDNRANTTAFYHSDRLGNVTMLASAQQVAVAKYIYDPFGNILSASGALADANLYRFSGKEFHVQSGLSYFLLRFYDPNFERWQNNDPIVEDGFRLRAVAIGFKIGAKAERLPNPYTFCDNRPIGTYDPLGTACDTMDKVLSCTIAGVAAFCVCTATTKAAFACGLLAVGVEILCCRMK